MSLQKLFRRFGISMVVGCLCTAQAVAGIGASENESNPSTATPYMGDEANGFEITADVTYDPASGPWIKRLINDPSGSPIASGVRVDITETITNTGSRGWTDWHEDILPSVGSGGGGGGGGVPSVGFVFDKNSLSLMADYGGGFQALNLGSDYTVTEMPYTGPGANDQNMGLEAIWIFFEPHAIIQTGDILKIEKRIFEVFGDGNVWEPGEFVEIAQYPTVPEPSAVVLATMALALFWRWRFLGPC